uniref:P2X purinoceptor 3 n=1 Tax=Sphaerodactylus townsendi TaxID=933632 RepID=A0ACB8G1R8_9SAUR
MGKLLPPSLPPLGDGMELVPARASYCPTGLFIVEDSEEVAGIFLPSSDGKGLVHTCMYVPMSLILTVTVECESMSFNGTSVFVIITKLIVTENQVQGICPEKLQRLIFSPFVFSFLFQNEKSVVCESDNECKRTIPTTGGGILTGLCVNYNATVRTCQIQGWCPAEVDTKHVPVMLEAENFTLFIKNSIRFPLFNFEKGNLLPNLTTEKIRNCHFDPEKEPFCPILRLGDIVKFANQDFAKLATTVRISAAKL